MKLLAFDQSTNITGYSIWESGNLVDYGIIDLHKIKDSSVRFPEMIRAIKGVIDNYCPDMIVIEDVAQQSNVNVLKTLAQLQGCIYVLGMLANMKVEVLKPAVWRQALGFKQGSKVARAALKQQALEYIQKKFTLDVIEDVAEAICIGQAWCLINTKE